MPWGGDYLTIYDLEEFEELEEPEADALPASRPPSRAAQLLDWVSDLDLDEGVA